MNWSKGVIAAALVMLVAACGSNTPKTTAASPATHATAPATTPTPKLSAELLSVSDLPTGWSVVPSTDNGPEPKCLQNVRTELKPTGNAEITFAGGSNGLPALDEALIYLPGQAQNAMAAVAHAIAGCGHISETSGGLTLTGSIGAMSFPAVADQSSAYQMNLTGTASGVTVTLGLDLIVFRKADTVALILYGDLGTPDVGTLQQIVQEAAAKLS